MSDIDRYDLLFTVVGGTIVWSAIIWLGAPMWLVPAFLALAVTVGIYRHFDLHPRRRQKTPAEHS